MGNHETPSLIENSQFKIFPVYPDRVNVPPLESTHTVLLDETVPDDGNGMIVISADEEATAGHAPFFTRAL